MAGKDARATIFVASRMKKLGSLAIGAALLVAVALSVRYFKGPGPAAAQAPAAPATQPARRQPSGGAATTPQSQTLAVVNGQAITRQELAQACLSRYGNEVLEAMLNRFLILNACKKHNITVTQQEIDGEIQHMAAKFGLSVDRYLSLLKEERKIDPEQYGRDIVWPTLALRKLAATEIQVTQEEVNRTIESELGERVKVRMISLENAAEAQRVHQLALANPDDFGRLAKELSKDRNSAGGWGLIPPVRRHVGNPIVEQAVFALQPGQISPVVEAEKQFLIFRCETRIPATQIKPEDLADAEQRVVDHLRDKKLRVAASTIFKRLQDETKPVNVLNDPELSKRYPGVAAQVGDMRVSIREVSEECLKRHGPEVLTGEINRKILMQELVRQGKVVTEEQINAEISRAAISFGYQLADGSANVDAWLEHVTEPDGATVALYISDAVWPTVALKTIVGENVEVTEEDLKKGFEANFGERVEAMAIVVGSMRDAQKVWQLARDNPSEEFFGKLAEQYSIEPVSRGNRGRVPPIQRHGGQPLVENEAFRLQPGELSGIIAQGDAHIILRSLGHTKPVVTDFEAVREELLRDIREKKIRLAMATRFDHLMERSSVDNFLAGTSRSPANKNVASRTGLGSRVPFRQAQRR